MPALKERLGCNGPARDSQGNQVFFHFPPEDIQSDTRVKIDICPVKTLSEDVFALLDLVITSDSKMTVTEAFSFPAPFVQAFQYAAGQMKVLKADAEKRARDNAHSHQRS